MFFQTEYRALHCFSFPFASLTLGPFKFSVLAALYLYIYYTFPLPFSIYPVSYIIPSNFIRVPSLYFPLISSFYINLPFISFTTRQFGSFCSNTSRGCSIYYIIYFSLPLSHYHFTRPNLLEQFPQFQTSPSALFTRVLHTPRSYISFPSLFPYKSIFRSIRLPSVTPFSPGTSVSQ